MNIDINSESIEKQIRNIIKALIRLMFRRAGGVCGQVPYKNASPSMANSQWKSETLLTYLIYYYYLRVPQKRPLIGPSLSPHHTNHRGKRRLPGGRRVRRPPLAAPNPRRFSLCLHLECPKPCFSCGKRTLWVHEGILCSHRTIQIAEQNDLNWILQPLNSIL